MARPGSTTSETGNNYNTANGTGAAVRAKLNEIFSALRTFSSGSSDPSGAANIAQYQAHINTSTNLLKIATAVSGDNATYNTLGNITLDNLGHVVAASPTMTGDVTMSSTGFLKIPLGTDAQQPYKYLLELLHKDLVHPRQETSDLTVRPLLLKYITDLNLLLWGAVLELQEEVMMRYFLNRTLT